MSTLADRIGHIVSRFCGGNASEFARRIRVTPQYANQLIQGERANPSEAVRMRICATFGVTDRWLMEGGDPMMRRDATHLYDDYVHPTAADPCVSLDFLHAYISLDADNRRLVRELVNALSAKQSELADFVIQGCPRNPNQPE